MWLISLLMSVIGAVLFFAPVVHVLPYLKEYNDIEEAEIFFVSFFAESKFFIFHSLAVLLSFLAFLTAIFSFFREKDKRYVSVSVIIISLVTMWTYILGYDKLFQILSSKFF
jgi:uncharacterized membrane protein